MGRRKKQGGEQIKEVRNAVGESRKRMEVKGEK